MEIALIWIVAALVVAFMAFSWGRRFWAWFFYGLLIWPIALIHLLVAGRTEKGRRMKAIDEGRRRCPHCAEFIRLEARVCPFCRTELHKKAPDAAQASHETRPVPKHPWAAD